MVERKTEKELTGRHQMSWDKTKELVTEKDNGRRCNVRCADLHGKY